jgi:hypothetical protein
MTSVTEKTVKEIIDNAAKKAERLESEAREASNAAKLNAQAAADLEISTQKAELKRLIEALGQARDAAEDDRREIARRKEARKVELLRLIEEVERDLKKV